MNASLLLFKNKVSAFGDLVGAATGGSGACSDPVVVNEASSSVHVVGSDSDLGAGAITGYIGDVGRLKGDSNVEEGGMQSDNKFDLLVDVVDGREKLNLSPKKSRLIDGGWLI
ncbi:hypothetical protein V6N11_039746 [Hibiscus sabdariffa]|uniref:Uncharacterized protein n=1 Tax=Hibiscus sabdariffa TaxID=183260 RepID=A0ABR2NFN3_9ROSI